MSTTTRYPLLAALAGYLLLVARITLGPDQPDAERDRLLGWAVDALSGLGLAAPTAFAVVEALANVLLFVPYGLLLGVLTGPGRRWAAAAVPALSSVAIELAQAVLLPLRVATVQDVVMNTTGAGIGVLVAAWCLPQGRRRPAVSADPSSRRMPGSGSAG